MAYLGTEENGLGCYFKRVFAGCLHYADALSYYLSLRSSCNQCLIYVIPMLLSEKSPLMVKNTAVWFLVPIFMINYQKRLLDKKIYDRLIAIFTWVLSLKLAELLQPGQREINVNFV